MGHIHDEHTHTHAHSHAHEHHEHTEEAPKNTQQTKALRTYMVDHNEHHAEELAALLESLPEAAGKKLVKALGTFEAANVELREVLDSLE